MTKSIITILAFVILAGRASGNVSETQKEIEERYGKSIGTTTESRHGLVFVYESKGFGIAVCYGSGISKIEGFSRSDHAKLTDAQVETLLAANSSGHKWKLDPSWKGDGRFWIRDDFDVVATLDRNGGTLIIQDAFYAVAH
jgi:hypothetical protein